VWIQNKCRPQWERLPLKIPQRAVSAIYDCMNCVKDSMQTCRGSWSTMCYYVSKLPTSSYDSVDSCMETSQAVAAWCTQLQWRKGILSANRNAWYRWTGRAADRCLLWLNMALYLTLISQIYPLSFVLGVYHVQWCRRETRGCAFSQSLQLCELTLRSKKRTRLPSQGCIIEQGCPLPDLSLLTQNIQIPVVINVCATFLRQNMRRAIGYIRMWKSRGTFLLALFTVWGTKRRQYRPQMV
jgi:hypothetical protein